MRTIFFILLSCLPCLAQLRVHQVGFAPAILKPATAAASFPSGATHYWKFQNDLTDDVGSFDLSDSGAAYVAGKNGNALECGDGVSANSDANPMPTTVAFSIVVWIYPTAESTALVQSGSAGAITISGGANWTATAGVTADTLTGSAVTLNEWHLLVLTYDGSSVEKLSVDGGTFVTGTVTVEDVDGPLYFYGNEFPPRYDECAFFTRALTQQEVNDIWNGGTGRFGP